MIRPTRVALFSLSMLLPAALTAAAPAVVVPLAELERQARARTSATAFVPLAPASSELFRQVDSLEPAGSGRQPNYLRALAVKPAIVKPFASLIRTFVYEGTLPPALKLAMATRIAQVNRSPYAAVHMTRLLRATGQDGATLLARLQANQVEQLPAAERLALRWAELQTADIYGMSDEEFRQMRGWYSDAEVVELTFTVCFFNYFSRMVEGMGLPVEPWVLDPASAPAAPKAMARERVQPRVGLISDSEIESTGAVLKASREPAAGGLGLGMANSQRAMFRVPALAQAWRAFGAANGQSVVGRDILLQVSFAVSMANGCRYCTIHQVVGLRRLGVDPTKLLAMEKDDSRLTPKEKTAVTFARKLTAAPSTMTAADYAAIRQAFGEQGALEVLLQTCNFAFMNRFTDGLRLPSEDEAIKIYKEVYGREGLKPRG